MTIIFRRRITIIIITSAKVCPKSLGKGGAQKLRSLINVKNFTACGIRRRRWAYLLPTDVARVISRKGLFKCVYRYVLCRWANREKRQSERKNCSTLMLTTSVHRLFSFISLSFSNQKNNMKRLNSVAREAHTYSKMLDCTFSGSSLMLISARSHVTYLIQ